MTPTFTHYINFNIAAPVATNTTNETDSEDEETLDEVSVTTDARCPWIAQYAPGNEEKCPDWFVQDEGKSVAYVGKSSLTFAKQKTVLFHPDVEHLLSLSNIVSATECFLTLTCFIEKSMALDLYHFFLQC